MLSRQDMVAASIMGSTIAVCGTCIWLISRGVAAGDLLGFLGGALGAGLAVGGSVFLDRRSQRNDRLLLADAIYTIGSTARTVAHNSPELLAAGLLTLKQAIHTFDTIRAVTTVRDAQAQRLLSLMTYWVPIHEGRFDAGLDAVREDDGRTLREFETLRPTLEKIFSLAAGVLEHRTLWPTTGGKALRSFEEPDLL
jgi:hypothetical protein